MTLRIGFQEVFGVPVPCTCMFEHGEGVAALDIIATLMLPPALNEADASRHRQDGQLDR